MIISQNGWSRLKDVGGAGGRRQSGIQDVQDHQDPPFHHHCQRYQKMYPYHLDARNRPDIIIFIIVIIVIEAGSGSRWEMMLFPAKSTHNLLVTVKAHIKHIWNTHTSTNTSCEVRHSDTNKAHLEHSDTNKAQLEHTLIHSDTNKNTSGDTQPQKQTHLKPLTQTKTQKHIERQNNTCAHITSLSMTVIKTHRKWSIFPLLDNYCHRFWRCLCQLDAAPYNIYAFKQSRKSFLPLSVERKFEKWASSG